MLTAWDRALLLAIREPSPAMIAASHGALRRYIDSLSEADRRRVTGKRGGYRVGNKSLKARLRYQAMIDVAIEELD